MLLRNKYTCAKIDGIIIDEFYFDKNMKSLELQIQRVYYRLTSLFPSNAHRVEMQTLKHF